MRRSGMTRPGLPRTLLLSHFTAGAAHLRDGFGPSPGVTSASFGVALVDDASVEYVDSDGVASECAGGEVERAHRGRGG